MQYISSKSFKAQRFTGTKWSTVQDLHFKYFRTALQCSLNTRVKRGSHGNCFSRQLKHSLWKHDRQTLTICFPWYIQKCEMTLLLYNADPLKNAGFLLLDNFTRIHWFRCSCNASSPKAVFDQHLNWCVLKLIRTIGSLCWIAAWHAWAS